MEEHCKKIVFSFFFSNTLNRYNSRGGQCIHHTDESLDSFKMYLLKTRVYFHKKCSVHNLLFQS